MHEPVGKWTELAGAQGGYLAYLIRRNLYAHLIRRNLCAQISCCLQRHLVQAVIDRRVELACDHVM